MKKITALALLSIALISCKKETQTITKIDPKTGKTITVEMSADKVENQAIKDSAGVYQLNFILEKGKTYPFTTYQRDLQTVSSGSQSVSGTNESTDEMSFTVEDIDEKGNYELSMILVGKRMSISSQGKTSSVDTRGGAPQDPQQKFMWSIQKAQTGNKLLIKMTKTGKIISIKGFEPIYQKINTTALAVIKDPIQTKNFMEGFKQGYNEPALREELEKNIMIFPTKGAKLGQSWTHTQKISADGKIIIMSTYTLKKVDHGIAEIIVKGGIPRKANTQTKEGLTHSLSLEGYQSGTIQLDTQTGWMLGSKLQLNSTEKESLTDGKQSQTMIKKTNSLVSINPNNKF